MPYYMDTKGNTIMQAIVRPQWIFDRNRCSRAFNSNCSCNLPNNPLNWRYQRGDGKCKKALLMNK